MSPEEAKKSNALDSYNSKEVVRIAEGFLENDSAHLNLPSERVNPVAKAHPNLARAVCIAGGAGSVSMGAALLVSKNRHRLASARDFVATLLGKKSENPSEQIKSIAKAHPSNLALAICAAEGLSAGVSVGAAWLVTKNPQMIEPARDFIAGHVILPFMGKNTKDPSKPEDAKLYEQAQEKASVMLKGVIMTGAGFASFVATQCAMEGRFDGKELGQVVKGKSLGLAATIASMAAVNKLAPGVMHKVEDAADAIAAPLCGLHKHSESPNDKGPDSQCEQTRELARLGAVEVISSVICGGTNYLLTKGFRH